MLRFGSKRPVAVAGPLLAAVIATLVWAGCAGPARVVLEVDSAVVEEIVQLNLQLLYLDASDGTEEMDSVRAPEPAMVLTFPVDMSLSLPSWAEGTLFIDVEGVDPGNTPVGHGTASVVVSAGTVSSANVTLVTP
jgi:hypothetical protein